MARASRHVVMCKRGVGIGAKRFTGCSRTLEVAALVGIPGALGGVLAVQAVQPGPRGRSEQDTWRAERNTDVGVCGGCGGQMRTLVGLQRAQNSQTRK